MKPISKHRDEIKRILILQTAFLGDVILTIPLIKKTTQIFPNARVDFLTIPNAKNLVETIPYIHQLHIYDKHKSEKGLRALFSWQKKLRQQHYDLAIVPHRSFRSALLIRGSGIPLRIGFNSSAGHWFFTESIPYPKGVHEINRNLHLLKPFGQNPDEYIKPELYFTEDDYRIVEEWMVTENISSDAQKVVMAPGSVWATKRWLPERYGQLANDLVEQGREVILIGGDTDAAIGEVVLREAKVPLHNAIGRFTLRQSALLIQKSDLLITNDSAPLHLGVAVSTPVLAIFGPTVPAFGFYPYGEKDRILETKGLSCRPCSIHGGMKCPIGTFDCMKNISVKQVLTTALEMLNENS